MALTDLTSELNDFADTAALIEALDLVISVDTSVAHLAGALGKPVWLLNRFDTCWRWLLEREDSPWYPSMRLFRQPAPGNWTNVIGAVRAALQQLAAAPRTAASKPRRARRSRKAASVPHEDVPVRRARGVKPSKAARSTTARPTAARPTIAKPQGKSRARRDHGKKSRR
jgi:hypothetical protein